MYDKAKWFEYDAIVQTELDYIINMKTDISPSFWSNWVHFNELITFHLEFSFHA